MNRDLATRRAFEALASGDYAQAAHLARTILKDSPNDRAALTVSGRLAIAAQELEVARALFDRILAQPPQRAALDRPGAGTNGTA
ncbi:MAG: tetratricopeptide repeat protein [Gammaproteobacteria bacterium]|nr:tetratricopeptide repeat protein [Gammaproteobacteria bacterium]